ncbi:hypothetical protein COM59_22905 [Bacillus pseudomycoides]|uniref:hypothetical protein n=1 Tax=Bacillus pseudomycoides TaxID=64104 RepID=UPI000BF3AD6A|nr:hypothetical protein [Bacillus pseudomycoides]PGF06683.1 hypothetical protein COM59_22905 [Bacillus pseudomycoides]
MNSNKIKGAALKYFTIHGYEGTPLSLIAEKDLYRLLQLKVDLFQKNEQLKFWLRMSFFRPVHLAKAIEKLYFL